ncbi:MAG: hypothetical protein OXE87_05560 [Chloroflexi bacterium]|nr:hypothetical protein [Chloroflexota bacterium]
MVANLGKGQPNLTDVEISALGKLIYRQNIRPLMTEKDIGKYVIVDVYNGAYEIDENSVEADMRLRKRQPDACGLIMKVGYSVAYFSGGYTEEPEL